MNKVINPSSGRVKRGFTLIELLVVIAIIGILAVVILAALSQARKAALDAKKKEVTRNVMTAIETYNATNVGNELFDVTSIETLLPKIGSQYLSGQVSDYSPYIAGVSADGANGYCVYSVGFTAKTGYHFYAKDAVANEIADTTLGCP